MVPFLKSKLPSHLRVDAAELDAPTVEWLGEKTGYALSLGSLKLHSLLVQGRALVLDVDTDLTVD